MMHSRKPAIYTFVLLALLTFWVGSVFQNSSLVMAKAIEAVQDQPGDPKLVKDINPGSVGGLETSTYVASDSRTFLSARDAGVVIDSIRYFLANDGKSGTEPWRSDGTESGTWMVKDINPGAGSGLYGSLTTSIFVTWNGGIFFRANDGSHGDELWYSDGTQNAAWMVTDINPGAASSAPFALTATKDNLFFFADDGVHGNELWVVRAAAPKQAVLLKDTLPGSSGISPQSKMAALGNQAIFAQERLSIVSSNVDSLQLWRSDGTEEGTVSFFTPTNGVGATSNAVTEMQAFDGKIYLSMDTRPESYELWVTDASEAGTKRIQFPNTYDMHHVPTALTVIGSALYFHVINYYGQKDVRLGVWKIDAGTETPQFLHLFSAPGKTITIGSFTGMPDGQVFFYTGVYDPIDFYPTRIGRWWKTNGTEATTMEICAECGYLSENINLGDYAAFNGRLYFRAASAEHGVEVWATDGTPQGTQELADLNIGAASSNPGAFASAGRSLYLSADDGSHGRELWIMKLPDLTLFLPVVCQQPNY